MHVDFCSHWDNPFVLDYNKYYLQGLNAVTTLTSSTRPWYLAPVRDVDANVRLARLVMQRLFMPLGRQYEIGTQYHVGQYILDTGTQKIRFAIDAHDNKKIASKPILDWCDLYFKSNKWTGEQYPSKVLPVVNGNGLHTRKSLAFVRSLRNTPKEYDFTFVSRLATAADHNIKLFESLSRLKCRKLLIAILYREYGQDKYTSNLEARGVTCVYRNIRRFDLWTTLAKSRVNFLRLGMKSCVPWRMIDLLCMGSAIVIDRHPFSDWPVPLRDEVNFTCCFRGEQLPVEESDYARVANTVERLLDAPERIRTIAEGNATYFDHFASPPGVASYLVDSLLSHARLETDQDVTVSDNVAPWPAEIRWINEA